MGKSKRDFDFFINAILHRIPYIGLSVWDYYIKHGWFQRFVKFSVSAFVIYWMIRAPMIWFFTELLCLHYLMSAFVVGVILSLVGFAVSELWVWKKRG